MYRGFYSDSSNFSLAPLYVARKPHKIARREGEGYGRVENGYRRAEDGDNKKWNPVIYKHRRYQAEGSEPQNFVSLVVDNLPEEVDVTWLNKTFTKFGIVRDVFIPLKSVKSGKRFGFVRYDCLIAAQITVSRGNGLWCFNKRVGVKVAAFDRNGKKSLRR
ncbi:hypothetical protein Acr_24g0008570 [Actinidia rufa]|uniref:RRM domain-containing protein n=1 Tax=Actinidia rufa TaxID=165716 RepID=A0A7J0GUZ1_9ERIC|nr:hypothetical protein Acr_24g0008570 [Actinidia rufa]